MHLDDRARDTSNSNSTVSEESTSEVSGGLLSGIHAPSDLRRIPRHRLGVVSDELRQELIELGAGIGGHFAGSLGTVELTVGLHWVFDTPRDRLVWDVGHQAYGHKALTGRREALARIKKADGPSGFLRRCESPFDVFGAGHAGTSVSAALGVVEGLRRQGRAGCSVAILGDGAATSGMSFEALNHAGHLDADMRVVFNDNGMSIAPSIGGLKKTGDARKYFECDTPLPEATDYMLMVYPIKKRWHKKIPSVTHVDGSGRLQSIRKKQNPLYYAVIKEFGKLSGIPILINTSFNIRGEPIVCTPHDAYKCMMGTGIDYIVMDKFLIQREDNPQDMWNSEKHAKD